MNRENTWRPVDYRISGNRPSAVTGNRSPGNIPWGNRPTEGRHSAIPGGRNSGSRPWGDSPVVRFAVRSLVRVLNGTKELVYPRRCPVCDRPVNPAGALICPECEGLLKRVEEPACRRCGKPLRSSSSVSMQLCPDCRLHPHIYERGCAVFTYHSVAGSLFRFKYKGRQEYGTYFGRCMAEKLAEFEAGPGCARPDFLVPVPVSEDRLRKRGYNQALILAREISRLTGIPVRENVLRRVTDTLPMKNMTPEERQNNLKRAFQSFGNDVSLNSIMLIDDIYTTGATIDACAHALLQKGAERVFFMSLAIGEDAEAGY
jgi:ComF family protein